MSKPKKIQDVFGKNTLEEQVQIKDPDQNGEIVLEEIKDIPLIQDISLQENSLQVDLSVEQEIILSEKKGKNFDALEISSGVKKFFLKKNIILKKKKETFHFELLLLSCKRYLKSLSKLALLLLGISIFGAIIFLGYLDKVVVENRVNAGYQKLLDVREGNLGFHEIQKKVNNARFDLLIADTLFFPFALFGGDKIDSVEHVISGGRYLSESLDSILSLTQKTKDFVEEKEFSKVMFSQLFFNISPEVESIEKSLKNALSHYESITWLPDASLEEKRQGNIIKIQKILGYISTVNNNFDAFLSLLGHEERKRYLIVFQNTDEIRPTGGFMGSMGLLEIFRGQVQIFQKKDVYAIEWDLKKSDYERLPAPKGLSELTDTFGLRDANYYANLQDSSDAIKFFTDRAGLQIDGIVYINQNILLRLLEITGPVYFEPLGRDITAQNFSELMSLAVEAKTFKEGTLGTPKQVLFDFMEVFFKKLQQDAAYFDYVQSLLQDVESRDLMVWSFHSEQQKFLRELKLDGSIEYDRTLDYLFPVYTSLSGNKSDRYMKRKYRQSVTQTGSCDYEVKFEIQSTHDMGKKRRDAIESFIAEYNLDTPNLLQIQGAERNRQFVRIILPQNAEIIPQNDVELVDYGKRKGVEFFLETQLQQTSFFTLEYLLKNPDCKPYNYTFYKQAGIPSYDMIIDIAGETFAYPGQQKDFYFEKR